MAEAIVIVSPGSMLRMVPPIQNVLSKWLNLATSPQLPIWGTTSVALCLNRCGALKENVLQREQHY